MGLIFTHTDDLEVVQNLLGKRFKNIELNHDQPYETQAGLSILIDETYEIIPVHHNRLVDIDRHSQTIKKSIAWDVWRYDRIPATYEEPEDCDMVELKKAVTFDEAILTILNDIDKAEFDNAMEYMYYEDMARQENEEWAKEN